MKLLNKVEMLLSRTNVAIITWSDEKLTDRAVKRVLESKYQITIFQWKVALYF